MLILTFLYSEAVLHPCVARVSTPTNLLIRKEDNLVYLIYTVYL